MRLVARAAFGSLALACGVAPAQFNNPVLKDLQGRWQLIDFDLGAGKLSAEEVKALDMTLVIEGNRFSYWAKGKKDAFGRIAVDASQEPPTLVRVETDRDNDLWTWCLYELKGDTLRLCQDVKGKGRPKEFKATADTTVATFKRVKP